MPGETNVTEHIHFVTGRLARPALERLLPELARAKGFAYSVDVLPITVAALMTVDWIAKHWKVPRQATRIILPGYISGEIQSLNTEMSIPVERGPRDFRQLPQFFADSPLEVDSQYGDYDIEIIAEINNCPRLSLDEILGIAKDYHRDGANLIDLGCDPGYTWANIGDAVKALRDLGYRVSVDSFNPTEVSSAVRAGAELVLSVNSSNCEKAAEWGVEVVAVPNDPKTMAGLEQTIDRLAADGVRLRVDPILEPIPFGFAESLGRFLEVRRRYPDAEMMMGIGNLTELTDVDSAGINVLLMGFCQELGVHSVLTTQVINWARTSVKECDAARKLVYYAQTRQVLPKHIEPNLIMLRDERVVENTVEEIDELATEIRDHNYRIALAGDTIHLISTNLHLSDSDPFALMEALSAACSTKDSQRLDTRHAFYLGYEMAKAKMALTLGKNYVQDEPLDWGLATTPEIRHYLQRPKRGSSS